MTTPDEAVMILKEAFRLAAKSFDDQRLDIGIELSMDRDGTPKVNLRAGVCEKHMKAEVIEGLEWEEMLNELRRRLDRTSRVYAKLLT